MSPWWALPPLMIALLPLLTLHDRRGTVSDMNESPDRARARKRQELRRSSAAQPIPAGKHKRPRSRAKQQLRQEHR